MKYTPYLFLGLALTLNAAANILLKLGAARLGSLSDPQLLGRVLTNYLLLGGLALFAGNVVFYIAALARLDLSVAYPVMTAGGVLIVVSVSVPFLRESLSAAQLVGMSLLVLGIVLVTRGRFA